MMHTLSKEKIPTAKSIRLAAEHIYKCIVDVIGFAVCVACIFIPVSTFSQSEITVTAEPSVDKMMERFIAKGKAEENTKAWRIQIITTDNRREMEQARATFSKMYPDMDMEWKHIAPYYQVRVGFFEKKQHLMPMLLELKRTFPAATPVYDSVSKRSLVNN